MASTEIGPFGSPPGLIRDGSTREIQKGRFMADNKAHPTATEMDYPAHQRNYSGFLTLLKWSIIIIAPLVLLVLLIIS